MHRAPRSPEPGTPGEVFAHVGGRPASSFARWGAVHESCALLFQGGLGCSWRVATFAWGRRPVLSGDCAEGAGRSAKLQKKGWDMPSWNIHIAHAEGLLAKDGPVARVVRDRNAFLFGNLIPDIYVGYMVPGIVHPIPYRVTHFAKPEHIPKPREAEFWAQYVAPMLSELGIANGRAGGGGISTDGIVDAIGAAGSKSPEPSIAVDGIAVAPAADGIAAAPATASAAGEDAAAMPFGAKPGDAGSLAREVAHVSPAHAPTYELEFDPAHSARFQEEAFDETARASALPAAARHSLFDMVLGAWTHLLADTIWNSRVSDYLDALGEKPSKGFRIKKQGDFDQFGKSLAIDAFPASTPGLIDTAAQFPQYAIDERSVYFTCAIAHEIVRTNHLAAPASYRLLTEEFFAATFDEVQHAAERLIDERL